MVACHCCQSILVNCLRLNTPSLISACLSKPFPWSCQPLPQINGQLSLEFCCQCGRPLFRSQVFGWRVTVSIGDPDCPSSDPTVQIYYLSPHSTTLSSLFFFSKIWIINKVPRRWYLPAPENCYLIPVSNPSTKNLVISIRISKIASYIPSSQVLLLLSARKGP